MSDDKERMGFGRERKTGLWVKRGTPEDWKGWATGGEQSAMQEGERVLVSTVDEMMEAAQSGLPETAILASGLQEMGEAAAVLGLLLTQYEEMAAAHERTLRRDRIVLVVLLLFVLISMAISLYAGSWTW